MKKQSKTARTETRDQWQHTATKPKPPAPALGHIQIRERAEALYAARNGMMGLTVNDWLRAEQELKQQLEKQITKIINN
jgi:hypothetical protein